MEKNQDAISLGTRGGLATKKKLGIKHFRRIAKLRWSKRGGVHKPLLTIINATDSIK